MMPGPQWVWVPTVTLVAIAVGFAAIGHFIDRRRPPPQPADVALVFGTGLPWKANARLRTVLSLYERGLVRDVIVSGGVRMQEEADLTEAAWFRARLVAHGVPGDRIHEEARATNTAENAAFALPIIEAHRFRTIVLVMSDFEGIRAHLTAKRAWFGRGLVIYDWHAPSPGHWHRWTWWLTPEGWRLTWYTVPRLFRYRLLPYLWMKDRLA